MAKFRIRLKLQGLDLEVDGERQDLPGITHAVQRQLASLVIPGEVITNGHKQLVSGGDAAPAQEEESKRKRSPRRERRSAGDGAPAAAIEFRHDPVTYGNPTQSWSVTDKCIWLLLCP